jgi:hypothetical protein
VNPLPKGIGSFQCDKPPECLGRRRENLRNRIGVKSNEDRLRSERYAFGIGRVRDRISGRGECLYRHRGEPSHPEVFLGILKRNRHRPLDCLC